MREVTWDEILTGLDSMLEFCRSLRLDVETSRFMEHRNRLFNLIRALKEKGDVGARELYDSDRLSHIVALTESGELASVQPYVLNYGSGSDSKLLRSKLRDVLGGPVLPDEENEHSNHSRNILFEINLAAKLWTAGLTPILRDRPDLSCEVAGKKLLIECKRPLTEAGARSRIRRAMKTIDRETKLEKPGTRGVVAMSITKLINPGDAIFSGTNEADTRAGLNELVRRKATDLSGAWSRSETKVIGIMFYVITPAFLEDRKILALQRRTNGYSLALEGSADLQAFKGLMSSLEKVWYWGNASRR